MTMQRRELLAAAAFGPMLLARPLAAFAAEPVADALRTGGVVLAMRHALAPGTFDPPQFKLGDCSTQRNLSDAGREQARRTGAWFKARALVPARVRSSPWCRCVDTATLAFGNADAWPALGSPRGSADAENAAHLAELRRALAAVAPGRFEVWVTHQFVISDLVASGTDSGEGLVLRAGAGGAPTVLARLQPL